MVAAVILWKVESPKAVYADPAVSLFIAIMIMLSSVHLIKHSGIILLQSAPLGVDLDDVKHDLEQVSTSNTVPAPIANAADRVCALMVDSRRRIRARAARLASRPGQGHRLSAHRCLGSECGQLHGEGQNDTGMPPRVRHPLPHSRARDGAVCLRVGRSKHCQRRGVFVWDIKARGGGLPVRLQPGLLWQVDQL